MRLQCLALILRAAPVFSSGSVVDLSHSGPRNLINLGGGGHAERELKLLGTDPPVDVHYDGTDASCPLSTGRRFDAERTNDPECSANPDDGWELLYTLEIGNVKITSCPKDKVLKISGPVDSVPTDDDCNFLHNLASDIVKREQYKNKLSVEAMSVKGAEILCDWPAGLSMNYQVNFDNEWNYQRNVTLLFDSPNANVIMNKPREDFMYDDYYQSLCFALGDRYLMDEFNQMAAHLGLSEFCPGDSGMMMIGGPTMEGMTCQSVPQDASQENVNWARGNCFGRCGKGCGGYEGHPTQFTNDCADYDFCSRFMVDREGGPNDCFNEFLHTLDDTLWSGNCDINTKMEEEFACVDPNELVPTAAPVHHTPAFNAARPVVVTYIQGGSCASACSAAAGSWECSVESLSEQNFRFTPEFITSESTFGLGVPCNTISPAGGSFDPTVASYNLANGNCVPSAESRGVGTFSCDAATGSNEIRFCTCYPTN